MKQWKKWLIRYCPDIRILRKCMNKIKCYRIAKGCAMRLSDITKCEEYPEQKKKILEKYKKKYAVRTKEVLQMLDDWLKDISVSLDQKEYLEVSEDVLFCHFAYGFRADEYFMYELRNKSAEERKEYISDRELHSLIIYELNDIIDKDVLRNKIDMYKRFQKYYKREAVGIVQKEDFEQYCGFVERHSRFVEKSARENCGRGIRLIDLSVQDISKEDYFHELLESGGEYLLEECIIQSEEMMKLNQTSVNSVRFETFLYHDRVGTCCPILRIGRNGAFIDNAVAGGIFAPIDIETGKCKIGLDVMTNKILVHPDTGMELVGFPLPEWSALVELVKDLAKSMPTVRYVGWDFAYTEQGWVMVEGNAHAQTHFVSQIAEGRGLKRKMQDLANGMDIEI